MTHRHPFHALLPQQALPLRRMALKLTRNDHRAEDLVQDTLLKAWAKRGSYSQLEAADACVCSIGTIKSRIGRGRAALDRMIGDEPVPPCHDLPKVGRMARNGTLVRPSPTTAQTRWA